MKLISIIAPCYNEFAGLPHFYATLKTVLTKLEGWEAEILFVDDGSSDQTWEKLQAIRSQDETVRIFSFTKNFGYQHAIKAGLDQARGEVAVILDTDLEQPPSLIPKMLELWEKGYEVVSPRRTYAQSIPLSKQFFSKYFYRLLNCFSPVPIPEGATEFGLYSRKAYCLLKLYHGDGFLRGLIAQLELKRAFFPYQSGTRTEGKSRFSYLKMVGMAWAAVKSCWIRPLYMRLHSLTNDSILPALFRKPGPDYVLR